MHVYSFLLQIIVDCVEHLLIKVLIQLALNIPLCTEMLQEQKYQIAKRNELFSHNAHIAFTLDFPA